MTTALQKSIDLINEILRECEDATFSAKPAPTTTAAVPSKAAPSEGAHKQGKKEKKKKAAKPDAVAASTAPATQDPMATADLRVAKVVSVEAVDSSDKLWKCQVNVGGEEMRQVIAGLQPYISKDVMEGLLLVVICNLKPAKLAGEASEAMILAATSAEDSSVVRTLQPPAACKPGDKVFAGNSAGEPVKVMKSKPWATIVEKLKTEKGKPAYAGSPLTTHLGECSVPAEIPDGSTIR
eukprot:jgi/Ulvmu1/7802/UM004_0031.1